jgi:integrase
MEKLYILFWLNKSKSDSPKNVPIYCRITVSKPGAKEDRKEISTGKFIEQDRWEYAVEKKGKKVLMNDQRVRGSKNDAILINRHLDNMKNKIDSIFQDLERKKEMISASKIKSIYTGRGENVHTILSVYRAEIDRKQELVEKGLLEQTYITTLESKYNNLEAFIIDYYKTNDYFLHQIDYTFLKNFEHWGKTKKEVKKGNQVFTRRVWVHNTAMDNLKRLKEVTNECWKRGWIIKDPFISTDVSFDKSKFKFLEEEELQTIESKDFGDERLNQVRDIFVFCCYTALAFADVLALTEDNLTKHPDGTISILKERKKTAEPAYIPLLDKAKAILEKYKNDEFCIANKRLLPVMNYNNYNDHLKNDIARIAGIKKHLTTHVARHTAATFLLNNGVPGRTICEIMGITSEKVLNEVYGKLLKKKVNSDIRLLQSSLTQAG